MTDVPMLEAVGFPHAVNPDRESAQGRGRPRLAGAGLQPAGRVCSRACTCRRRSRRSPHWRSAGWSRWVRRSGSAPGAARPDACSQPPSVPRIGWKDKP
ncbi:hypothetical protein [Nocardioides convexus]|uniref:hypothetical protein n=1 Tax=Nocardioides convexus TaxID=2712224 RepID=UPI003101571B